MSLIKETGNKKPSILDKNKPGADKPKILIKRKPSESYPKNLDNKKPSVEVSENLKPIYRKSPKKFRAKKSPPVQEIFAYWEAKGLPSIRKGSLGETIAIRCAEELLEGTLFKDRFRDVGVIRKYSVDEVKKAIDTHALRALNIDYEPMNKVALKKVRLDTFFYNPRVGTEELKSYFLTSLFNKPVLLKNSARFRAKDEFPHVTKVLVNWYKDKFRMRIDRDGFPTVDYNDCVYAVRKLKEFLVENKDQLRITNELKRMFSVYDDLVFLALMLTRAFDKELRENENLYLIFNTKWFCSERTLKIRLPRFLREERVMKRL
jgi:hypothetical protein